MTVQEASEVMDYIRDRIQLTAEDCIMPEAFFKAEENKKNDVKMEF